ncbi:MAG: hypothetical protein E6271_05810 [Negativicoccus succinicivorans]|nr:hypothetical protein [Negativicoccus succinicivorans]
MSLYVYTKTRENIATFERVIKIIYKNNQDVFVSVEHKRNFRELKKIKTEMSDKDILIISTLHSLGLNEADILNELNYFIQNRKLLVICNIESTYKFGISQPMNWAVLNTLSESILLHNTNIIKLPENKRSNAGRNKIEFPDNWEELYEKWEDNKISSKEFLDRSGLKRATFYNMITEYREILEANKSFIKKYRLG